MRNSRRAAAVGLLTGGLLLMGFSAPTLADTVSAEGTSDAGAVVGAAEAGAGGSDQKDGSKVDKPSGLSGSERRELTEKILGDGEKTPERCESKDAKAAFADCLRDVKADRAAAAERAAADEAAAEKAAAEKAAAEKAASEKAAEEKAAERTQARAALLPNQDQLRGEGDLPPLPCVPADDPDCADPGDGGDNGNPCNQIDFPNDACPIEPFCEFGSNGQLPLCDTDPDPEPEPTCSVDSGDFDCNDDGTIDCGPGTTDLNCDGVADTDNGGGGGTGPIGGGGGTGPIGGGGGTGPIGGNTGDGTSGGESTGTTGGSAEGVVPGATSGGQALGTTACGDSAVCGGVLAMADSTTTSGSAAGTGLGDTGAPSGSLNLLVLGFGLVLMGGLMVRPRKLARHRA